MTTSTISRKDKQDASKREVEAQHVVWLRRIQDIMRDTGKTPMKSYLQLCQEVEDEVDGVPPQCRKQFKEAWSVFQEKVRKAAN